MKYAEDILHHLQSQTNGISTESLCRTLKRSPQQLGDSFEMLKESGKAVGFAGHWFETSSFEEFESRILAQLRAAEQKNPNAWVNWSDILPEGFSEKTQDRIFGRWQKEHKIRLFGRSAKSATGELVLNTKQQTLLTRVEEFLMEKGWEVPSPRSVGRALRVPEEAIQHILALGIEEGSMIQLEDDLVVPAKLLAIVEGKLKGHFSAKPFTAAEARDALESNRRVINPILRYWDAKGITIKNESQRTFASL